MAPPDPSGLRPIEAKIVSALTHQIAIIENVPMIPPSEERSFWLTEVIARKIRSEQ